QKRAKTLPRMLFSNNIRMSERGIAKTLGQHTPVFVINFCLLKSLIDGRFRIGFVLQPFR
ncbi:MAG: hypothetical protein VX904_12815, partial [Planctomycetota bacterium]|nr:hypothetical protein [Planctomycetota bacterium]